MPADACEFVVEPLTADEAQQLQNWLYVEMDSDVGAAAVAKAKELELAAAEKAVLAAEQVSRRASAITEEDDDSSTGSSDDDGGKLGDDDDVFPVPQTPTRVVQQQSADLSTAINGGIN